ncbi:MAG TPA: transglutaminase family protein, partial [Steroidobacteraceae bacterium]
MVAEMAVLNPFDFFLAPYAEQFPFKYDSNERRELVPYLVKAPATVSLASYLAGISRERCRTIDFLVGINQRLAQDIRYVIRLEPGVQLPEETLAKRAGSCRDSAALLVQLMRHLGLAARFVSGYLIQLVPDVKALDGPVGAQTDFTDLHAWCEVYLPGAGWIGLDPTSGLLAAESHIPLAATPHYRNAAPISGLASFANVDFAFDMRVDRVAEHPRITKPFSEDAWTALDALGEEVDRKLVADDVRLTMGGEPTFVSIDDFESGEWNADAVGPTKRALADRLIRRLRDRFAPGGFLHYGQGKWYPGESLPRWTFSLYWRRDLKPIWRTPERIAAEGVQTGASKETAEALLGAIASELGIASDHVAPAYEDPAEWLVKEANLPANVSPENSELKDPEERHRIARVFSRGLTEPSGYVLPVQRWQAKADGIRWRSEKWKTRRGALHLVPGDSPV